MAPTDTPDLDGLLQAGHQNLRLLIYWCLTFFLVRGGHWFSSRASAGQWRLPSDRPSPPLRTGPSLAANSFASTEYLPPSMSFIIIELARLFPHFKKGNLERPRGWQSAIIILVSALSKQILYVNASLFFFWGEGMAGLGPKPAGWCMLVYIFKPLRYWLVGRYLAWWCHVNRAGFAGVIVIVVTLRLCLIYQTLFIISNIDYLLL